MYSTADPVVALNNERCLMRDFCWRCRDEYLSIKNHIIKTGRIISRKSDRDTGLSLEHYFNISMAGEGSVNPSSPLYFSYDL